MFFCIGTIDVAHVPGVGFRSHGIIALSCSLLTARSYRKGSRSVPFQTVVFRIGLSEAPALWLSAAAIVCRFHELSNCPYGAFRSKTSVSIPPWPERPQAKGRAFQSSGFAVALAPHWRVAGIKATSRSLYRINARYYFGDIDAFRKPLV